MRWAARGLWVAAWGAWAWCGCGLYRVLPKELGPATFRLPRDTKEGMIGFLHTRRSIITVDHGPDARFPAIRLRDERMDAVEREIKSDGVGIPPAFGFFNSLRHGLHGRSEAFPPAANTTWPVFVLDLATGEWRKVDDVGTEPRFHPARPWGLFTRGGNPAGRDAVVVDLKTGAPVRHADVRPEGAKAVRAGGRRAARRRRRGRHPLPQ